MDKRVYYGEYSLQHWIELILKENIVLPWYQRSFVWEKSQIENLIKTIDNNEFIPPIIIGAVKKNDEWTNYILDGQQRLTSILFAHINKYIDTKAYSNAKPEKQIPQSADDLEDPDEETKFDEQTKIINWNFKEIVRERKFNEAELANPFYKKLADHVKAAKWFNENFLGFAYIKPSKGINEQDQSKFYSNIFRNINSGASKLTRQENRKSLYFLKEELKNFFVPDFLSSIKVQTSSKESGLIDFVKYLSILAQYRGNNNLYKFGGRIWEKNENYYQSYIMAVVEGKVDNELGFDVSYPAMPYNSVRIDNLRTTLAQLDIPKSYASIVEMDMYFFGLINEIVFRDRQINVARRDELKASLEVRITQLKETENHKDNPHALKYLKARIEASTQVYAQFIIPQG